MDNMDNTSIMNNTDSANVQIAPWHVFSSIGFKGRIVVVFALLLALSAVTVWGIHADVIITEIISGYVTVFFMLWLAAIDVKSFILPNKLLLAWLLCRAMLVMAGLFISGSVEVVINSVSGAGIIGLFFLLTYYLSKRSLGGGDVKLSFVLGLSLTISMIFTAVFYGLIICALFSLIGLALKKLKRKDAIPLGPFLFVGTVVAYFLYVL